LFTNKNRILKDPIKYRRELEGKGIKFTIDRQYGTYVNNRFSPYLSSNAGLFSGLYRIGQPISNVVFDEDTKENSCVKYSIKDDDGLPNDSADTALRFYHELYRHSLFPTKQDVIDVTTHENLIQSFKEIYARPELKPHQKKTITVEHFDKLMIKYFKVDIKTLFKYFPGVYYSISCRVPCDDKDPDNVFFRTRRITSRRNLQPVLPKSKQ
jgi:hypothetical protein